MTQIDFKAMSSKGALPDRCMRHGRGTSLESPPCDGLPVVWQVASSMEAYVDFCHESACVCMRHASYSPFILGKFSVTWK